MPHLKWYFYPPEAHEGTRIIMQINELYICNEHFNYIHLLVFFNCFFSRIVFLFVCYFMQEIKESIQKKGPRKGIE